LFPRAKSYFPARKKAMGLTTAFVIPYRRGLLDRIASDCLFGKYPFALGKSFLVRYGVEEDEGFVLSRPRNGLHKIILDEENGVLVIYDDCNWGPEYGCHVNPLYEAFRKYLGRPVARKMLITNNFLDGYERGTLKGDKITSEELQVAKLLHGKWKPIVTRQDFDSFITRLATEKHCKQ